MFLINWLVKLNLYSLNISLNSSSLVKINDAMSIRSLLNHFIGLNSGFFIISVLKLLSIKTMFVTIPKGIVPFSVILVLFPLHWVLSAKMSQLFGKQVFFVSFDEHLRKFCRVVLLPEDEVIPCNECAVLEPVNHHVTTD